MKIIIHLSNKSYEKSLKRFLNYRWKLKEVIEFRDDIQKISSDEVLLTDDFQMFSQLYQKSFLLAEETDMEERRISKYTKFDDIVKNISPMLLNYNVTKSQVKLITISSVQGGSGKSAVLKHLSHILNMKYRVCILNLFGNAYPVEASDLSEFMLEYENVKVPSNHYFYSEPYAKYVMPGFVHIDEMEDIAPKSFYKNIMEYISAHSIDIILFEIPHPSISICKYFIKKADYNLIIKDCRRILDTSSHLYLEFMNSLADDNLQEISNHVILENFSNSNSIFTFPDDDHLFKSDGNVNENSIFYHKIKEFSEGVLDV